MNAFDHPFDRNNRYSLQPFFCTSYSTLVRRSNYFLEVKYKVYGLRQRGNNTSTLSHFEVLGNSKHKAKGRFVGARRQQAAAAKAACFEKRLRVSDKIAKYCCRVMTITTARVRASTAQQSKQEVCTAVQVSTRGTESNT